MMSAMSRRVILIMVTALSVRTFTLLLRAIVSVLQAIFTVSVKHGGIICIVVIDMSVRTFALLQRAVFVVFQTTVFAVSVKYGGHIFKIGGSVRAFSLLLCAVGGILQTVFAVTVMFV